MSTIKALRFPSLVRRTLAPTNALPKHLPREHPFHHHVFTKRQTRRDIRSFSVYAVQFQERLPMAPDAVAASRKLEELRTQMQKENVSAFVVPSSDPHLLEYAPDRFQRRAFISGFTGSAGTAVITTEQAALWTDGRYFLQAEKQLSKDWTLMKHGTPGCPEVSEWLTNVLPTGSRVGIDPYVHSEDGAQKLKTALKEKEIELVGLDQNLVDVVWSNDRPKDPMHSIFVHPVEIAGESTADKLKRIREEMEKVKASILLVAKVEEIAWTLNLRGNDEPYSPIFIAYLIITHDSVELYTETAKVPQEVQSYLQDLGVHLKPYDTVATELKKHLSADPQSRPWLDSGLINHALFLTAKEVLGDESEKRIVKKSTPLTMFMAVKNPTELEGMREAHIRDAIAVIEFLSWFEKEIASGRVMTEVQVDEELTARRAAQKGFRSCSFPTIAGANANGAVIHYHATAEECKSVDSETLLLIDSGGQYDCGTTDITRTFHLGTPTDFQKTCFTKVLQGHIAMATSVFPDDTPGVAIDAFARRPLWSLGLQYMHGTGHGVGAYMCVHEGPISVSHRAKSASAQEPLKMNMVVSNEPGYYQQDQFGIRIESLVVVKKADTPHQFNDQTYLGFETITFVPLQKKLMKLEDMSAQEIAWVDNYHQEVWEKLHDKVSSEAREWLRSSTEALSK